LLSKIVLKHASSSNGVFRERVLNIHEANGGANTPDKITKARKCKAQISDNKLF